MIKIKGLGIIEQILPSETKIIVRTKYFKHPSINGKQIRQRLFKPPVLKELKDVTKCDYIGIKINQNQIPIIWSGVEVTTTHQHTMVKNSLPLNNNDFWWFIGRLLADGWTVSYKRQDRINGYTHRVVLCCGKHEFDYVNEQLNKLFFKFTISEERTTYKFTFNNWELWAFFNKFGRYAHGKLIPNDVIDMPIELLKSMLDGYFSGDGYIDKMGNQTITTVSENLANSLKEVIYKVYKTPVKHYINDRTKNEHYIEGRKVNQRVSHILSFKVDKNKQDKAFYENGYIWVPLNMIESMG